MNEGEDAGKEHKNRLACKRIYLTEFICRQIFAYFEAQNL